MPETVGVVPLEGRGSLPFVDLHGEVLFLHAVRALLDVDRVAGRVVVTVRPDRRAQAVSALDDSGLPALVADSGGWWREPAGGRPLAGRPTVLLHDPLCPLVPAWFLSQCLEGGRPLVAYRPVTDTIKTVVDDQIVDTLDRDRFGIVASPVVFDVPPAAATGPGPAEHEVPPTTDFGVLATWLRSRAPVLLRRAPSLGRRVDDLSAVNLLECMDEMARTVRET
jgi:hypothetical protein